MLIIGASLLACLCLAPAAALADSSPANAAKKKAKRSPKVLTEVAVATTVAEVNASAIATCPEKTRLVGGGFATQQVPAGGGLIDAHLVSESRRLSDREWIVTGLRIDNGAPGNPVDLSSYAQCRKLIKKGGKRGRKASAAKKRGRRSNFKLSEESASITVSAPFAAGTATARCPGRQRAVAGGFSMGLNTIGAFVNFGFPMESFRSATADWTATMLLFSPDPRTVTSYVYCAQVDAPERLGTAILPGTEGSVASALSEVCPRKRRLGGGGHRLQVPTPPLDFLPTPLESRPDESGWRTTANQGTDGAATTIVSQGICL